jgi:RNA polymerase sigma-70 factor (ECF subfamily)
MPEQSPSLAPMESIAGAAGPAGASQLSTDDRTELMAARAGDQQAAERMVERHGESMKRTAWRVLGRYGGRDSDDVVQDALIAALTTGALPGGDVGAWLRAIVARKALDELRRKGRHQATSLAEADDGASWLPSGERPEGRLDVITVRETLGRLRPVDRAVLTLVDLEGWSIGEAAKLLGLTYVATKLRASRARRKLARMLREDR